jgi:hypothetical protein
MNEEILRIMKMLEEGKITAEQATALVTAVKGTGDTSQPSKSIDDKRLFIENDMAKDQIPGQKMLQVRVLSEAGDKVKVNLPLNFVKAILKVTGKIPMMDSEHLQGVNIEELMDTITIAIDTDLTGRIVDVESATGDLVIIDIVG